MQKGASKAGHGVVRGSEEVREDDPAGTRFIRMRDRLNCVKIPNIIHAFVNAVSPDKFVNWKLQYREAPDTALALVPFPMTPGSAKGGVSPRRS